MNITTTFDLTENAKRRTPEDFDVSNQPMPINPFPDIGDFVSFEFGKAAYEFKVIRRQFNYRPNGELHLVILVD